MTQEPRQSHAPAWFHPPRTHTGRLVAVILFLQGILAIGVLYSVPQGGLPVAQGAPFEDASNFVPTGLLTATGTLTTTDAFSGAAPLATATPGPTNTPRPTQTPTNTRAPTITPRPTNTPRPTQTPTNTRAPTITPRPTNTPRPTQTPTNTRAPTDTPGPTDTPRPTQTPTNTRRPTQTPTDTPTSTATRNATPTPCCVDTFNDPTGQQSTFDINGAVAPIATATSNPFFQNLGTNGRTCDTCHREEDGWTIVTKTVNSLFNASQGLDPLFRTVDGSNSPTLPVSTTAQRRIAYSMLLSKAVIRVGLPMPANAQFTLTAVNDPYGFASAAQLSLFRRPLPSTNLNFLSTVMWDGRETLAGQTIAFDLQDTSNNATLTHAQATQPLTASQEADINTFQLGLFSAQSKDNAASSLNLAGASGGPLPIPTTQFFIGINDPFGGNPSGTPFTSTIFTQFAPWASLTPGSPTNDARLSIERGENLFNTATFQITGVNGLNDVEGQTNIQGTCGTCHDTPGIGTHSVNQLMNTGVAAGTRRTPDMPLYTFTNITTTQVISVTDPGLALITGQWADIGKFKVPGLRNLAARAPYFHDGSAASLTDVVNFYNTRFNIGLSAGHIQDLVNFLAAQ